MSGRQTKLKRTAEKLQEKRKSKFWEKLPLYKLPKPIRYTIYAVLLVGIGYVATNWNSVMPSFITGKTSKTEKQAVTLRVDGWRVLFSYHVQMNRNIALSFVNETTHDTIRMNYDNDTKIIASPFSRFSIPIKGSADPKRGALLPLLASEPNRITAFLKTNASGKEEILYQLDTIITPKSIVRKSAHTIAYLEDPYNMQQVDSLLAITDETMRFIRDGEKPLLFLGSFEKLLKGEHNTMNFIYGSSDALWGGNRCVFGGSAKMLSLPEKNQFIFHESVHAYDIAKKYVSASQDFMAVYQEMMVKCGFEPYPLKHTYDHGTYIDPAIQRKLEQHPLISLFMEKTYNKTSGGNPYSNNMELFASTSTILRFYSQEFFDRVRQLGETRPDYTEIAMKVARGILKIWGNDKVFSDDTYLKLGTDVPTTSLLGEPDTNNLAQIELFYILMR